MRDLRRCASLILALGACGTQSSGPAAGVAVELAGGPNCGRYQNAKSFPTCSRGLVGQGSWAIQYSDRTGPKGGAQSLQLVVPAAARPEEFYLGMVFGDFFAGTVHETRDPRDGSGGARAIIGVRRPRQGGAAMARSNRHEITPAQIATIRSGARGQRVGAIPAVLRSADALPARRSLMRACLLAAALLAGCHPGGNGAPAPAGGPLQTTVQTVLSTK